MVNNHKQAFDLISDTIFDATRSINGLALMAEDSHVRGMDFGEDKLGLLSMSLRNISHILSNSIEKTEGIMRGAP